eukprot:13310048-Alexandrium_andersonii.AAC.1
MSASLVGSEMCIRDSNIAPRSSRGMDDAARRRARRRRAFAELPELPSPKFRSCLDLSLIHI